MKLARAFTWESIAGALPAEVASLSLQEFCTGGFRSCVSNFEDCLVGEEQQVLGRTPRVLVADRDWWRVCKGPLTPGACSIVPRSQLHHVQGQPVLNGLFSVSKNECWSSTV